MSVNLSENKASDTGPLESDVWISDEIRRIFQWVVYTIMCQIVAVFGIVANAINITCFFKQGFTDSVNVNFFGLAISDMGCLITQILISTAHNPEFQNDPNVYVDFIEFSIITFGWPRILFARVTSLMTALITMERCLCITMPLKVKTLVTPRRATGFIIGIYVYVVCSILPIYFGYRIGWKFSSESNTSVLGLVFTPFREITDNISSALNIIVPLTSFVIIIICTASLVVKLKQQMKWRVQSTVAVHIHKATTQRDQNVTRMVVALSVVFIICYVPVCVSVVFLLLVPELSVGGKNFNLLITLGGVGLFLECVNSSVNIFLYYHMSSKYRAMFKHMFRLT